MIVDSILYMYYMGCAVCKRRSICVMSARNIRATAHAPRSQRTLNMFTTQILTQKRPVSRCLQTGDALTVASGRRGGA